MKPQFQWISQSSLQPRGWRAGPVIVAFAALLAAPAYAQSASSAIGELQTAVARVQSTLNTFAADALARLSALGTKLDAVLANQKAPATKLMATSPIYRQAGYGFSCDVVNAGSGPVSVTVTIMKGAQPTSIVHSGPVNFQLAAGAVTGFNTFAFDAGNPITSSGFYWCKFESTVDISALRGSMGMYREAADQASLVVVPAR